MRRSDWAGPWSYCPIVWSVHQCHIVFSAVVRYLAWCPWVNVVSRPLVSTVEVSVSVGSPK